jgi:cephalosporin hydroxylase
MILFDLPNLPLYWEMSNSEKHTLLTLLKDVNPSISIEIGTKEGGSLQLISALSKVVYSIDIDVEVKKLGSLFDNVEFVTGDSKKVLPALLSNLESKGLQPDFILIDGDHSFDGGSVT